jgi:hypothetical protein
MPNVEAVVQAEVYRTTVDVRALIANCFPALVVNGALKHGGHASRAIYSAAAGRSRM